MFIGDSARWSWAAGASVSYRFTGRSIAWIAAKLGTSGKARVSVDGRYVATVNLQSTGYGLFRRIVFRRSWSSVGTHTIRIVAVASNGNSRIDIDAFVRT